MLLPGGTLRVSQTLPPIDEPPANRNPAENRRTGIDHNIILDNGVPVATLEQGAVFIHREPLGTQRHALIQPHMFTDHGGLADDDAGSVIDEKAGADLLAPG